MARIQIPPSDSFNPLNDDEVVLKASDELLKEDSFDRQSQGAMRLSEVNSLMAKSRAELGSAVQQRIAQPLDDQGNPNFSSLVPDVQTAGEQIFAQNSANIQDPAVKRQYELQFKNEIKGAQIKAKGLARQQQLQFMEQSFRAEHESLVQSASVDPFRAPESFMREYQQKVDAGVTLGLFTQEQRNGMLETFRSDVSRAQFNALIELDPAAAESILINNPERTGLKGAELEEASKLVDAKIRDIESQQRIEARNKEAKDEAQRKIVAQDLVNRIESGEAGQADILRAKDLINPQEIVQAERKLAETKKKNLKADKDHKKLLQRVTNGDNLADFTPGQIQKSYSKVIDQMRIQFGINEGERMPLSLKASVARVFKGRINSLEQELEHALQSGGMDDAVESLNAYRILSQENPEFTSFLHQNKDKAGDIANYALTLVDKTDVPEQAAIQRARGAILNADDVERNARGRKFGQIKDFKAANIGEVAREELGGDPLFGFDRRLAPGVVDTFHDLARESYINSGDKDAAIKSARNQMQANYGETEFNGGRLIMFAPPEKMFPGVPAEVLKGRLDADLKSLFPQIDTDKVEIVSDDVTRIKKGFISYGLQIRDANGNPVPLINPETGQLVRWIENPSEVVRSHSIKSAVQVRERLEEEQLLFRQAGEDRPVTEAQRLSQQEGQLFSQLREEQDQ
jgi:hypothetical protein